MCSRHQTFVYKVFMKVVKNRTKQFTQIGFAYKEISLKAFFFIVLRKFSSKYVTNAVITSNFWRTFSCRCKQFFFPSLSWKKYLKVFKCFSYTKVYTFSIFRVCCSTNFFFSALLSLFLIFSCFMSFVCARVTYGKRNYLCEIKVLSVRILFCNLFYNIEIK